MTSGQKAATAARADEVLGILRAEAGERMKAGIADPSQKIDEGSDPNERRNIDSGQKSIVAARATALLAKLQAEADKGGRPRKGEKPTQKIGEVSDPHERRTAAKLAGMFGTTPSYDGRRGKEPMSSDATQVPEPSEYAAQGRLSNDATNVPRTGMPGSAVGLRRWIV